MPHKPEKSAAPTLAASARIILEWSSMARRGSVFNRRSYLEKCNRRNIRKSLEARVGIEPTLVECCVISRGAIHKLYCGREFYLEGIKWPKIVYLWPRFA